MEVVPMWKNANGSGLCPNCGNTGELGETTGVARCAAGCGFTFEARTGKPAGTQEEQHSMRAQLAAQRPQRRHLEHRRAATA